MEKTFELYCDAGDTIYMPWVFAGESGIAVLEVTNINIFFSPIASRITFETDFETDNDDFDDEYGHIKYGDYNRTWFTDLSKAEERLKELNNEISK